MRHLEYPIEVLVLSSDWRCNNNGKIESREKDI